MSVGQATLNGHARREIHWLAIAFRRFEFYLSSCPLRGLIEAVAKPADDAVHLDCAVRLEYQVEYHVTLKSHSTPFLGVLRAGRVPNVKHCWRSIAPFRFLLGARA